MNSLALFIAVPLGAAFLIAVFRDTHRRAADIVAALACLFNLGLAVSLLGRSGTCTMGGWAPPLGINLVFDGLSSVLLILIYLIASVAALFSISYMETYTAKNRYYCLFLLMTAGMSGVVLTGDIFNLFVFLEVASIAAYALVGFGCRAEELEASFKYLVLGTLSSLMILISIGLVYSQFGVLNLAYIAAAVRVAGTTPILLFSLALFLMGFGLKAALVPFHTWLPDAHPSAPSPISAMLSGVLIKVLGLYAIIRVVFNVLGVSLALSHILVIGGIVSMAAGGLLALGQRDLKRMLAYSSISQVGYVLFALGVAAGVMVRQGPTAVAGLALLGGFFHLVNHGVFKALLFLGSGSLGYAGVPRDLARMGGLRERMPLTAATFTIGSLSISGLPPFSGFWSKLLIVMAAFQAGYFAGGIVAVAVSVITLAYYMKAERMAFFGRLPESLKKVKEVPGLMGATLVILASLCLLMGLLVLAPVRESVLQPAVDSVLGGPGNYIEELIPPKSNE